MNDYTDRSTCRAVVCGVQRRALRSKGESGWEGKGKKGQRKARTTKGGEQEKTREKRGGDRKKEEKKRGGDRKKQEKEGGGEHKNALRR